MKKLFVLVTLFCSISFADDTKDVAKILVVDKSAYEKIDTVNILNGGLTKQYVVNSSRINEKNLKDYYPEYFLYTGKRCQLINKVEIINEEYDDTHDASIITDSASMKKEIEKLKMLQALVDIGYKNLDTYDLNRDSIKAFGILCDGKIIIRQKSYMEKDLIGNLKVRKIDTRDNSIYLEVK